MTDPTAKASAENGPPQKPKSLGVLICEKCGVLVAEELKHLHEQWHERLRQSVDETDALG